MDSHNDSSFFTRLSKRVEGKEESFIVPPRTAQEEQARQTQKVHQAEIQELKQSLRYIEIQLARAKEENETQNNKIMEQQSEIEKGHENLAKQLKINQQQARQIEQLQKTIDSFNTNQRDLLEKNRFKASSYMSEINQREEELGRIRAQLLNNQDEMKLLTVSREQFRQQCERLVEEVRERDIELEKLRSKVQEQNGLMDSMVMAQKNLSEYDDSGDAMDKARDDIERAGRIARTTNKSSFMGLGEKQPRLVSEEYLMSSGQRTVQDPYRSMLENNYISDDSIPSEIFTLIQDYREKLQRTKSHQSQSLILDDFFGDVHRIMKDMQMRELARIRNEHSVEIMKLRKTLDAKLKQDRSVSNSQRKLRSKENFDASKTNDKFVDNEIERQRRALIEENELLKKRIKGLETIVYSGSSEKTKFMEGASWIAKKAHIEIEKHIQNMQNIMQEYQRKSKEYIIDERINEVDGKKVIQANEWISETIENEITEVGSKFESIFENVSYHLKEATKNFHKYK